MIPIEWSEGLRTFRHIFLSDMGYPPGDCVNLGNSNGSHKRCIQRKRYEWLNRRLFGFGIERKKNGSKLMASSCLLSTTIIHLVAIKAVE